MHARRFACFCLGLWLAGTLLAAVGAYQNLRHVDRLLSRENPAATLRLKPLGADARSILRFTATEQTRWYQARWADAQLIFGGLFFFVMLFGSRESKFLLAGILLAFLLVLSQKWIVIPELFSLGSGDRHWIVEIAYYSIEGVKGILCLALTALIVFSREGSGRSRDARNQFDRVDKPDYRRVYR